MAVDPFTLGAVGLKVIGGIFGRKARKKQRQAQLYRNYIREVENDQQRRGLLQQFNSAQATVAAQQVALAGGGVNLESSGYQGARASTQAQVQALLFENKLMNTLNKTAQTYEAKAAKYASYANLASVGSSIVSAVGDVTPRSTSTVSTPTTIAGPAGAGAGVATQGKVTADSQMRTNQSIFSPSGTYKDL